MGAVLLVVLLGLGLVGVAWGQTAGPVPAAQGARCRFVAECAQFDSIGLHLGTSLAVRAAGQRSSVDAQGGLRLSLTAGEVAEVGAALSGQLVAAEAGELRVVGSPVTLLGRVRLLPLPWGPLAAAPRCSARSCCGSCSATRIHRYATRLCRPSACSGWRGDGDRCAPGRRYRTG